MFAVRLIIEFVPWYGVQEPGKCIYSRLEAMIEKLLIPYISPRYASEPAYREGHVRIVNPLPGRSVLGLHVPDMKNLARELARRPDALSLLDGLETAAGQGKRLYYEEIAVCGLMLACIKVSPEERFARLDKFVPQIDNWAVCDLVCSASKWAAKISVAGEKAGLWEYLDKWWHSKREFELRFAIVFSICYFLDSDWIEKVFAKLEEIEFGNVVSEYVQGGKSWKQGEGGQVKSALVRLGDGYALDGEKAGTVLGPEPYYVRMAVAWLLATALAKLPDETRNYLRSCSLPEDVLKLYVRKARESFRTREVSPF